MSTSILQGYEPTDPDSQCYLCQSMRNLQRHHIFQGNPNRDISEHEGCWVWLCADCHRDVHNHEKREIAGRGLVDLMVFLHETCQLQWEHDHKSTHDDFRAVFGRSYL